MINVRLQSEPNDFDKKVRQPGMAFLRKHGGNPPRNVKFPNYWKNCSEDLAKKYNNICAYLGVYIISGDVDHFLPKRSNPNVAYEWSNYRFAYNKANQTKLGRVPPLDPFTIRNGLFFFSFISGKVFPNPSCTPDEQSKVRDTIRILGLNKKCFCEHRLSLIDEYLCHRKLSLLRKRAPFIVYAIEHQ